MPALVQRQGSTNLNRQTSTSARQLDDAASEAASLSTKLEASVVAQAAAVAEADRLRSEIEDHQQEVVASNESLCVEREASSTLHDQLSIAVQLRDETQQGAMALEARCKRLEESVRVGEDTVSQTMSRVLKLESERDSRTQVILDMEAQLSKVTRKALSYEARSRDWRRTLQAENDNFRTLKPFQN